MQTRRKWCYVRATDSQGLDFRILGPLEALVGGRPVPLGGAKARALLALLLLHRGETVARDRLIDELWGERPPKAVAAELRVYVGKLRKALRPDLVVTRPHGYAVAVEPEQVDADRFERAARHGAALRAAGDAAGAAYVLAEALAMWRGPAFGECADQPWAHSEARRLEELRRVALEERVEADLAVGRAAELVPELERLVAEEPYRERPRAQLMLALYRCGRQADALALYRETARLFSAELGIEPGPELRGRQQAILNHDAALLCDSPIRGSLPAPPTRLVGRRAEIDDLMALLRDRATRLITLTGPGGVGKTRLAIEVAARVERETGVPALFVEFASISDAALVLPTVARAVGVEASSRRQLPETLREHLRDRALVLVVDNFENLVEDAASVIAALLADAPSLTIIATSRRPLRVRAEQQYDVDPLGPEDALTLFVQRARAVRHGFAAAGAAEQDCRQICDRVDRLPLAIEIVAARARQLEPAALLAALDSVRDLTGVFREVTARQRTLWATIDWSYRLLRREPQLLLSRLSIFRGSFSFEAAQLVCNAQAYMIESLVDASVLCRRGDRFFMLETIRRFADAKVDAAEGTLTRRKHAEFYRGVAEQAQHDLLGENVLAAVERLEQDIENFRLAFEWWMQSDSPQQLVEFATSLSRLFSIRVNADEGAAWIERALGASTPGSIDPAVRTEALIRAAWFRQQAGHFERARRLYLRALALARRHRNAAGECAALHGIAFVALVGYGDTSAITMELRAVEIARRIPAERELVVALDGLGRFRLAQGRVEEAAEDFASAVQLTRKRGDTLNEAISLRNLANALLHLGRYEDAVEAFRHVVTLGQRLRSWWLTGAAVEGLAGAVNEGRSDPTTAVVLLGASEALFAGAGVADRYADGCLPTIQQRPGVHAKLKPLIEARARHALDAAAYDQARAEGRALGFEAAVAYALDASGRSRSKRHRVRRSHAIALPEP